MGSVLARKAEKAEQDRLDTIQGDGGRDGRLAVMGDWWLKGRPLGQESHDQFMLTGVCGPGLVDPYSGGGQGGPGHVAPYHDDGVPHGPGEEEEEEHYNRLIRRRVLVLEELIMKNMKKGGEGSGKKGGEGENYGHGQ